MRFQELISVCDLHHSFVRLRGHGHSAVTSSHLTDMLTAHIPPSHIADLLAASLAAASASISFSLPHPSQEVPSIAMATAALKHGCFVNVSTISGRISDVPRLCPRSARVSSNSHSAPTFVCRAVANHDDARSQGESTSDSSLGKCVRSALSAIAASAAAAALLCLPGAFDFPALAESITITFPASKIREVTAAQRTLIETWGLIRETYVDPTFNHQDWDSKLGETMSQILPVETADAAYGKIQSMLATLGDPFTRLVSPQEYKKFKIGSDGALEGVGLLIASDRDTGRLVVISSLEGGPAARAGIHSGDELVQIDDETLAGMDGEKAASKLRGPAGTSVKLKYRRDGTLENHRNSELNEVKIFRENITLSPVSTAVLPHMKPDGHLAKIGYLRLTAFSQNAAADMEKAISGLENEGADSYILDLRNNPGGLVKAGLDVAQMWLDGNEILVNTIDRDGNTLPIGLVNGHAMTHDPLAVLVNGGSASASEILAGALHDNGRAILVGSKTFGKGKIQSVTEMVDGSAVFVTVAKYLSPSLHDIDQVGITPDVLCSPGDDTTKGASPGIGMVSPIEQDSCILAAEHQLGIF